MRTRQRTRPLSKKITPFCHQRHPSGIMYSNILIQVYIVCCRYSTDGGFFAYQKKTGNCRRHFVSKTYSSYVLCASHRRDEGNARVVFVKRGVAQLGSASKSRDTDSSITLYEGMFGEGI